MKLRALTLVALICCLLVATTHAQERAIAWQGTGVDWRPVKPLATPVKQHAGEQ